MDGCIAPGEGGIRLPPPGVQEGGGTGQIRIVVNLLYLLGFPLQEGGGRVGIKEEEEANDSAMMNDEPKSGATGNDGHCGQLVVTIAKS